MARHHFAHDPLLGGWFITQAKLTIRFCPQGNGGGRSLPLTITLPNGCDLKDRIERERLIGEKYLRQWGAAAGCLIGLSGDAVALLLTLMETPEAELSGEALQDFYPAAGAALIAAGALQPSGYEPM